MAGQPGQPRWDPDQQRWVTADNPLVTPPAAPPQPSYVPQIPPLPSARPGDPPHYGAPPPEHPPASRVGWSGPLRAGAAVTLCCVLALGGWLVLRRGGHPAPGPTAISSPSGVPSSGQPSTQTAGPANSSPPAGFSLVQDDLGFTADIPDGWTRRVQPDSADGGGQVFFTQDNDKHLLQVGVVKNPTSTPYATFSDMEKQLEQRPGYQLLRLEQLDGDPAGPVEIEFTEDSSTFGRRHVIDRGFLGPDGTLYAVLVAAPDSEWPQPLQLYRTVVGSFCVTGYCQSATASGTAGPS